MSAPGTAVATMTDRERAAQACAHLRSLGILAAEAVPGDPVETRDRLRDALLERYPAAMGSLVVWSAEDEDAFSSAGRLERPLTLHYEGPATPRAVRAAFGQVGLDVTDGPGDRTLEVAPWA